MREEQRQEAIEEINKTKEEIKNFEELAWELSCMRNTDPQVRKYLELEQIVEKIRKKLFPYLVSIPEWDEKGTELIYKKISEQVNNALYYYNEEHKCNHPIWFTRIMSDNIYQCLECGKIVKVDSKKDFENEHSILKFEEPSSFHSCQRLYYNYLYECSTEEAVQKLIRKFNEK